MNFLMPSLVYTRARCACVGKNFSFGTGRNDDMQDRFASRAAAPDDAWLCFAWIITGNELIARARKIYMLRGAAAFCVFTLLG